MNIEEIGEDFLKTCPLLDGRYRVLFTLGRGRFSKVRLALHLHSKLKYAIKIIKACSKGDCEAFIQEVSMMVRAAHPSVITVVDAGIAAPYVKYSGKVQYVNYIVMPLAEHGQLYRLVNETGKLSEQLARYFFKKIVKGLENMHLVGIAHRDIKSENILLQNQIKLKIGDFGFAAELFDSSRRKFSFDSTEKVGSPSYNAPEQVEAQSIYDAQASDVFSLGVVLFQMIFSSSPFKMSSKQDKYFRLLCRPDKSAFWKIYSNIYLPSNDCKDLLERMMEVNPRSRIRVADIIMHPWVSGAGDTICGLEKQLDARLDTVMSLTKSQQEDTYARKKLKRGEESKKEQQKCTKPQLPKQLLPRFADLLEKIRCQSSVVQKKYEEQKIFAQQ